MTVPAPRAPDAAGAPDAFAACRDRLFALAYRMLGSAAEAEDVLQEAWLRWDAVDRAAIRDPAGWLVTAVSRLSIDVLRSARVRREAYVGPWLPEPIVAEAAAAADPADQVAMAESVSMAFLIVLESLSPVERAVFLLREVFGYGYDEIAPIVDRSEAACRQAAHRAREHVAARRPRFETDPARRQAVVDRFLTACATGDLGALVQVLADDVELTSDGGGKARAALRPVSGADRVARFLVGLTAKAPPGAGVRLAPLNASPGIIIDVDGEPDTALVLEVAEDRVSGVRLVRNPDKLGAVAPQPPAG